MVRTKGKIHLNLTRCNACDNGFIVDMVMAREVLEKYYHNITIGSQCDLCEECVAVCPTGALVMDENPGDSENQQKSRLSFNRSICDGCGLCAEFCPLQDIRTSVLI